MLSRCYKKRIVVQKFCNDYNNGAFNENKLMYNNGL